MSLDEVDLDGAGVESLESWHFRRVAVPNAKLAVMVRF